MHLFGCALENRLLNDRAEVEIVRHDIPLRLDRLFNIRLEGWQGERDTTHLARRICRFLVQFTEAL